MRKIFGHRGLPQIYIENTIKSLNKALEICDFVETDIRITRDEQLVLYHDPTIENKKIEELTLSEIKTFIDIDISEIHFVSRDQIKGPANFELKVNKEENELNKIFINKVTNLTEQDDII